MISVIALRLLLAYVSDVLQWNLDLFQLKIEERRMNVHCFFRVAIGYYRLYREMRCEHLLNLLSPVIIQNIVLDEVKTYLALELIFLSQELEQALSGYVIDTVELTPLK